MEQTEYKIFIVLATLILLLFINGIIIFIVQYRKRKVVYENEKELIQAQHKQEILSTQLQIQEQTMQDIGREIHDSVGQKLTLASIYANLLAFENEYPAINERISSIGSIISESLDELRGLSKTLTNTNTEKGELAELINNLCERINALNICKVTCYFDMGSLNASPTVRNFVLRIAQEFMQNSLKHASCKNINAHFNYKEEGLKVLLADDGVGFDTSVRAEGIGLTNMRKRAELIGAEFNLNSTFNKGTELHLFIPDNKLTV